MLQLLPVSAVSPSSLVVAVVPRASDNTKKTEAWWLLLLLHIRSVHLEILGFPMGGAY